MLCAAIGLSILPFNAGGLLLMVLAFALFGLELWMGAFGLADLDHVFDAATVEVPEFQSKQIVAVEVGLVEFRAGVAPEFGHERREVDAGELAFRVHVLPPNPRRKEVSLPPDRTTGTREVEERWRDGCCGARSRSCVSKANADRKYCARDERSERSERSESAGEGVARGG